MTRESAMNRTGHNGSRRSKGRPVTVPLDEEEKALLVQAAALRGVNAGEYLRSISLAQARREVQAAAARTVTLTPEEQLAFWVALNQPPSLTPAQVKLGAMMRGEA